MIPAAKLKHMNQADTEHILLHELAHMWFGNLVTMRWWDDLWLNETFATYLSYRCLADATRFSEGTGSLKATVDNLPGGYGYPGVELHIAGGDPLTDWRDYEVLIYDVWPEVNASALDQAPDPQSLPYLLRPILLPLRLLAERGWAFALVRRR